MAFDETFRFQSRIDEYESFRLIGVTKEYRELQPSNFDGPVAAWAEARMRDLGETIIPRHVYVETLQESGTQHRVAWVYHDGFNPDTGQSFCMHHVACDCSQEVDAAEDSDEKYEIMANCAALMRVLDKRAWLVNATYGMDNVLNHFYDQDKSAYEQNSEAQHFVIRAMMYMLEHDYRHPEGWMANVESGWNLINLMALVMRIDPEDVTWYAELLDSQGLVETDGTVVTLSQKLKDTIDAEKILREVAENVKASQAAA
jgi:hypothetical protein